MNHASRIVNFSSGPAVLPETVLNDIQNELLNYQETGMSILEMHHRSENVSQILCEISSDLKSLLKLSDDFEILFIPGGASFQFVLIPMNLLTGHQRASYINTGRWSERAINEARRFGFVDIIYDAKAADHRFYHVPTPDQLFFPADSRYIYLTSNNTVMGTQYHVYPIAPKGIPLVADMSSDILSKEIPSDQFGIVFAGAQKNLGAAGLSIVIIRKEILSACNDTTPSVFNYKTIASYGSRYNTPPVFQLYLTHKIVKWTCQVGGIKEMSRRNLEKSALIYGILDEDSLFWNNRVDPGSRSTMNIVWDMPSEELRMLFLQLAEREGMVGLA
ncbi:3-phosphoserine/phosphohydroxythreonine transaminase, partial [bacterium]|nr:3-phosphoserine/phosphohydroxythreonine transaminase [candidate division CSSED10-310 bacterium]